MDFEIAFSSTSFHQKMKVKIHYLKKTDEKNTERSRDFEIPFDRAKVDSRFTSEFRLKCPSRAMGNTADTL